MENTLTTNTMTEVEDMLATIRARREARKAGLPDSEWRQFCTPLDPNAVYVPPPTPVDREDEYEDKSLSAPARAEQFCKNYNVEKYGKYKIDPATGVIDVDGDIRLAFGFRKYFAVQFGVVTGLFDCHCTKLESLKGAPHFVGGDFNCGATSITSLEYAPQVVKGDFHCWRTAITNLKGIPREIRGDLVCDNTDLTSLEGLPKSIHGHANFSNNNITDYGILDLLYVDNLTGIYFDREDDSGGSGPGPSYGNGKVSRILNEARKAPVSRNLAVADAREKLIAYGYEKLADFSPDFKADPSYGYFKKWEERLLNNLTGARR